MRNSKNKKKIKKKEKGNLNPSLTIVENVFFPWILLTHSTCTILFFLYLWNSKQTTIHLPLMLHRESFLRMVYCWLRELCHLAEDRSALLQSHPRYVKYKHRCLMQEFKYLMWAIIIDNRDDISKSLTCFASTFNTYPKTMCTIRLLISAHCDCSRDHRTISAAAAMINLMGRWRNWWTVATICVQMEITAWRWWWCSGKHAIWWNWSFLLTILLQRIEVKSSGFAGASRWTVASWIIVEMWWMWSFDNCIGRSGWRIITTRATRHWWWTVAADTTKWTSTVANRTSPIICHNIFGFVTISDVSQTARSNRLIVNGINISSAN